MAQFSCLFLFMMMLVLIVMDQARGATVPNPPEEVPIATPHVKIGSSPFGLPLPQDHRIRVPGLQSLYPSHLKTIYGLSNTDMGLGAGKTIALVDAYGASTAEADLAVFSATFGLPPATTANGKFKKVNQTGGSTYPPDDVDKFWAMEAALDVQSAHAFAPGADILLVVCESNSFSDLMIGIEYAKQYADYISLSWGAAEGDWVAWYDYYYFGVSPPPTPGHPPRHPSFFSSTGDDGASPDLPVSYPASSNFVVAVGGTSVYTNADGSFVEERGWSGSGGGCSIYIPARESQLHSVGYVNTNCAGMRALPDLAMVGNPASGMYIYLSQNGAHGSCIAPTCFYIAAGTSLASPIVAARSAIRGHPVSPNYVHNYTIAYRDVTAGSNGAYECMPGLDLVTGRGSWVGPL